MTGWGAWNGPAAAYELTAALAQDDDMAAAVALFGLPAAELRGVVIALGAQARYAAHVAGREQAAAAYREQEQAAVGEILAGSPALPLALDALAGTADLAGPVLLGPVDLRAAALALSMAAIRVMITAGWSREIVAVICRRAAA